jgi:hypothetical protein
MVLEKLPKQQAWVIAASMGLGHLRPAYPLRDLANNLIITANVGPIRLKKSSELAP